MHHVVRRLFFLDLLFDEPLQLDHRGERLFFQRQLKQGVDLLSDRLLLLERLAKHVGQRVEVDLGLGDRSQFDPAAAGDLKIVQPHGMPIFLLALHAHSSGHSR